MSRAERSLALLDRLARARLACETVLTETGALLPDDECAEALRAAEGALDAHDEDAGYDRRNPKRRHGPDELNGGAPC